MVTKDCAEIMWDLQIGNGKPADIVMVAKNELAGWDEADGEGVGSEDNSDPCNLLILLLYSLLESWKALLNKMYSYRYYLRSYRSTWGVDPPRAGGLAPADPRDNT